MRIFPLDSTTLYRHILFNRGLSVKISTGMVLRWAAVGIVLAQLTACATIVKGHSQQINVATNPAGAICTLERDGQSIATVNPTPGTVTVEKSRKDLSVDCRKEGYTPAAGKVASKFHPMTFGNILFGGIIGLGVDAASGAMTEYDEMITVRLTPAEFPTESERDGFFNAMRDEISTQTAKALEQLDKECAGKSACDKKRAAAEKARDEALGDVEARRAKAKVRA
jgi:hypothetical protein